MKSFFDWLSALNDSNTYSRFSSLDGVIEMIYTQFLCRIETMPTETLVEAGYQCFESFFRIINGKSRVLDRYTSKMHFTVLNLDLLGLEMLQFIVTHARNLKVAESAASFLINLNLRMESSIKTAAWDRFIEWCMASLHNAESDIANGSNVEQQERIVSRVVWLLKKFLDECERTRGKGGLGAVLLEPRAVLPQSAYARIVYIYLTNENEVFVSSQSLVILCKQAIN